MEIDSVKNNNIAKIGISADFDPVHLGHVKLIDKAREIADKKNDK